MKRELELSEAIKLGLSVEYTREVIRTHATIRIAHITDTHLCAVGESQHDDLQRVSRSLQELFTDNHPGRITPDESFNRMVKWINTQDIDIAVLTGDIVHFPDANLVQRAEHQIRRIDAPVLYCPGNHDWHYPHEPWNEATRAKNYKLIAPLMSCPVERPADGYWEYIKENVHVMVFDNSTYQFSALHENCVKHIPDKRVALLFYHIPIMGPELSKKVLSEWDAPIMVDADDLWTEKSRKSWLVEPSTIETQRFVECLKSLDPGKVAGAFSGHVHLSHSERLSAAFSQHVTDAGFHGAVRIIDLIPA